MEKVNQSDAVECPDWRTLSAAQRKVLLAVRNHGPCTREFLGSLLEWPPSSVSREVSPLLLMGALHSDPPGIRRRNALLSTDPNLAYSIGVEIEFDMVNASIVDFNSQVVGIPRRYRPARRDGPAFRECVQKVVRELLVQPPGKRVLGVGIGFAERRLWNPAQSFSEGNHPATNDPLVRSLGDMFKLPVLSRCDSACAALGEQRSGRLRGIKNGLFLLYSTGIGLGIIAAGNVVFGDWNDSGEIGHMPLDDNGDYCHCGNVGCLETIAAKWALVEKTRQIIKGGGQVAFRRFVGTESVQVDELCAMAVAGDPLARSMLVKAGRALGRALTISASLFDPSVIVLGGCLSNGKLYQPLITATQETFQTLAEHRTPQPIRFETSSLNGNATIIGAAELVFSESL